MADTIHLKDGAVHCLIRTDAFPRLVGEYMGQEAEDRVLALDAAVKREELRFNSGMDSYEESLNEYRSQLSGIGDIADRMEVLLADKRLNRSKLFELNEQIAKLARDH